jgi:aspartate carbamoyltransferase catalytic subunit
MGAKVALCGPPTLIPIEAEDWGTEIFFKLDEALEWANVLNVLRLQLERQQKGLFPSIREYHRLYGITRQRLEQCKKEITILHPGPINRGVEIESELADSEYSLILNQVTNGVAVRMAVLYLLSGGKGSEELEAE